MNELRYVVLHHTGHGPDHYDLMFETSPGSALATWRSSDWPVTGESILTPLSDHRREYLEYEGEISGGRGRVKRVAAGFHRIIKDSKTQLRVALAVGREVISFKRA